MGQKRHTDQLVRESIPIRLSREGGRIVQELQQPGILFDDGCTKGQVIETAIIELAGRYPDITNEIEELRAKNVIPVEF